MKIAYLTNAPIRSGIGHRAEKLRRELVKQSGITLEPVAFDDQQLPFRPWPGALGSKSVNWIRWGRQLQVEADVYDLTSQSLSFLAKRFQPTVVTVHDLIEVIEPQDARAALINRYLHSGIMHAAHIVAVSAYTKRAITSHYGIPSSRISVIPNGVGSEFHPIEQFADSIGFQELRRELKLGDAHPIVLYVGSDHPRKNLPISLQVFARLREKRPDAVFIKVGEPGIPAGRAQTLEAIDTLGIRSSTRFLGSVSNERLNLLYNLANVLLYPSTFEGFGLPPLQAMAAGLPVVTSNTTALPEVVGDAAFTHDPNDVEALLGSVEKIVADRETQAEFHRRGINRAKTFQWSTSAEKLTDVYRRLGG